MQKIISNRYVSCASVDSYIEEMHVSRSTHRALCIVLPIAGTINASSGSLAALSGGTPKDRHSSKSRGCYSYAVSTRVPTRAGGLCCSPSWNACRRPSAHAR